MKIRPNDQTGEEGYSGTVHLFQDAYPLFAES